jgi:energy-coupling factor transporter ATP-binding protein EcfA2
VYWVSTTSLRAIALLESYYAMQPDGLVISIVAPETMLHAKLVLKERLHGPARRTIAEQYEQKANISHVLNPHEQAPEITNENNMSIDPATHACVREIEANVAKGHSMFLIGPEGSGKSGAIRAAVDHLNTQRGAVGSIVYHIIRISPLIHGDDAGKMRAIRLGLQHIIDCQSPGSEGMSKLEVRREFTEELEATKQALLSFLSAPQLVSGAMVQNRLVLQLEDVHMCAPSTGRQLFLYTLLELHAMVPVGRMAIVATTVRTDAYTLLEKRVASRFPPRIVYSVSLTSPQSLISTLASHLHLPPTVQAGFLAGEDLELLLSDWADFVRIFNDAVLQSFEHERVRTELTNMYYATTNMHIYLNLLVRFPF